MKRRFESVYLVSAGVILALTALGKVPPIPSGGWLCMEEPILGVLQSFGPTNQFLLWFAAGVELVILGLICFCPTRWMPCLAACFWGTLCLLLRISLLSKTDSAACHCLGWFEQAIPLSREMWNSILITLASWLAGGGWIAFRLTRRYSMLSSRVDLPEELAT